MGRVADTDGEYLFRQQILRRLVAWINADADLIRVMNPAPGGIHRVGRTVLVIGSDNQNRHRIKPSLCSEIFPHFMFLSRLRV